MTTRAIALLFGGGLIVLANAWFLILDPSYDGLASPIAAFVVSFILVIFTALIAGMSGKTTGASGPTPPVSRSMRWALIISVALFAAVIVLPLLAKLLT